ncbi:MAG TPA: class I SAM-dependent methyltransferase, partial [Beutenbergiaceae bacterium]|nr:class I SAM-dependent methyltransferase [Beutenbergiaceae bacterium]
MNDRGLELLLTERGWAFLNSLPAYDEANALTLSEALRKKGMDPDLVAAALTQSRLRAQATAKFGEFASHMLFTQEGLEQATRLEVAALHARRYAQSGFTRVADLGCGIGGDSLAFAALGLSVLAVEKDPMTATIAQTNLKPFPEARVIEDDAMTIDLDALEVEAIFMDPARRTRRGTRVFDPAAYSPNLDAVLDLRHRYPLGVKV